MSELGWPLIQCQVQCCLLLLWPLRNPAGASANDHVIVLAAEAAGTQIMQSIALAHGRLTSCEQFSVQCSLASAAPGCSMRRSFCNVCIVQVL